MVAMVDIAFIIMGCTTVGLSLYLLTIMKDVRILFIWGVSLTAVQIALAWMGHELKWHTVAVMVFFLFVLVIMMVKIKQRINAALKRIAQIEEEEEKQNEAEIRRWERGAETASHNKEYMALVNELASFDSNYDSAMTHLQTKEN